MLFSWLHRRRNILKRMIRSEVTTVSVSGKTYGSVSQAFQYTSSRALSKIVVHLPCVDSNCNTRTQLNIMSHVRSLLLRSTWKQGYSWYGFWRCDLHFMSCTHGRRKNFFQGALMNFSKIFLQGGLKMAKFVFSLSKLRKQLFFWNLQNQVGRRLPPDAHVCIKTVFSFNMNQSWKAGFR